MFTSSTMSFLLTTSQDSAGFIHLNQSQVSNVSFYCFRVLLRTCSIIRLKCFKCDGGGEFVNTAFTSHLSKCGIKQLISYPYTPQQNGIAERKHRHITQLCLSMLFDSKSPLKYWVEAFFTANFISNLLPSTVSNEQKSPYEALFGKKLEYSFLRVFGCACYPLLRPYASNKFEPWSLKFVFLGYNDRHKGYRCVYPPTGRIYISSMSCLRNLSFPLLHPTLSFISKLQLPYSLPSNRVFFSYLNTIL